jgi:hypothetical protein
MSKMQINRLGQVLDSIMVQIPVAALLNVCRTSSANVPTSFLKNVAVSRVMSWTTGCRPNGKQTNIWEFSLRAFKKLNPTVNDMKTKLN